MGDNIKKEHINIIPGAKAPIVEVNGGEEYVDACVEVAVRTKTANQVWDDTKKKLRGLGDEARVLVESDDGEVGNIHVIGSDGNYIEIAPSRRRKALTKSALIAAPPGVVTGFVDETTEVTFKGESAAYILTLLKSQETNFPKDQMIIKKNKQLVASFEEQRRKARAAKNPHIAEWDKLGIAGLFAASIEAKKQVE